MTTYTVKQMMQDHGHLKKGDVLVFDGFHKTEYFFINLETRTNEGWGRTRLGDRKLKTIGSWEGNVGGSKTTIPLDQITSLKSFIDNGP